MASAFVEEEKRRYKEMKELREDEIHIQAFFFANLMNLQGKQLKKDIQPKDLVEMILPKEKKKPSQEEIKQGLEAARERGLIPSGKPNQ